MWSSTSIPLGIEQSLDSIFAALTLGGIDRTNKANMEAYNYNLELYARKQQVYRNCLQRFKGRFPFNVFYNTYAIFYEILLGLKINEFSLAQLDTIVETNSDLIINSPYIDRSKYKETQSGTLITNEDFVDIVRETLKEKTLQLSMIEVTEEQFISSCNIYVDWFKDQMALFTSLSMSAIMQQGFEYRKPNKRVKLYKGLDDCKAFYNEQMEIINSLSEESHVRSTVLDMDWFKSEVEKEGKVDEDIMFKSRLREIDSVCGPLRRGNILGIVGPPKGGKTRFTNYMVQVALQCGFNVCVWPLEGTKEEWIAMQTACLIAFDSHTKTSNTNEMVLLSSGDIENHAYGKSKEMTKQVLAAKMLLASNTKLGKLTFMEGTAFVEDMFDQLTSHYENVNQFDVLVVDQLINVMSKTGKGRVERTTEAYIKMKDFLANKLRIAALGIMPSQLKQVTIDQLRKDPEATIDVTAGAETAETIRTPDEIWGLFSSKEERDNNIMKFYSVASRHNGSFPDFQSKCFLQSCFFMSQEEQ